MGKKVFTRIGRVPASGIIRFNLGKPLPFEGKWPGIGMESNLTDQDKEHLRVMESLERAGGRRKRGRHRQEDNPFNQRREGNQHRREPKQVEIVHHTTPGVSARQLDFLYQQHPDDANRNARFDGRTYYRADVGSNNLKVMIFKAKKLKTIISTLAKYDNYSVYPTNEASDISDSFKSLHILHSKWERPTGGKSLHEQLAGPLASNGMVNMVVSKFAERDVIYITHETKANYLVRSGFTHLGKWDGGTLARLSFFINNHKYLTKGSRGEGVQTGVDRLVTATDFIANMVSMFR